MNMKKRQRYISTIVARSVLGSMCAHALFLLICWQMPTAEPLEPIAQIETFRAFVTVERPPEPVLKERVVLASTEEVSLEESPEPEHEIEPEPSSPTEATDVSEPPAAEPEPEPEPKTKPKAKPDVSEREVVETETTPEPEPAEVEASQPVIAGGEAVSCVGESIHAP